jgi:hypothetical protein
MDRLRCGVPHSGRAIPPTQSETIMTDANNQSSNDAGGGPSSDSKPHDTLSRRLPLVAATLKRGGIQSVIAAYRNRVLALAFVDRDGRGIPHVEGVATNEIVEILGSLVRRRHPGHFQGDASHGTFEWNLPDDTLEHHHTFTHRGL